MVALESEVSEAVAAGEEDRVFDGFRAMADRHPGTAAVVYLGEAFTYARLSELIGRFAGGLASLGIEAGDRVLLYIGNSPQWVIAYLGAQWRGAVPVPVSPIYAPFELRHMVRTSGAETLVSGDTNFGYAHQILREEGVLRRIVWSNMADLLPWWKELIGRAFDRIPTGKVVRDPAVHGFLDLLKEDPLPPSRDVAGDDLAHILFTGGTTGLPKGIAHTHRFLVEGYRDILRRYREPIGEAEHVFAFAGPLFHMFWQDMFFATIAYRGNTAVLLPRGLSTDAILDSVQRYRATLFAGVPTLYRMLLENDRFAMYDLRSLRHCWSAGDLLPTEVYEEWRRKVGVPIHHVYGSTEMVVYSVSLLEEEDPRPPYVGTRMPTRTFLLVDPETREPVPGDEPGELLCRAQGMPEGYLGAPEETEDHFVEIGGRRWFRTGDFVRLEGDRVHFLDRASDIIKYKGYRVAAAGVEAVLQDHPAVLQACVVGVPDERVGERVKAFVVLKEDVRGLTAQDLVRWCRERLLPYEVPEFVEFRDALPKSKVGKLLRREMRAEERRRQTRNRGEPGDKSPKGAPPG